MQIDIWIVGVIALLALFSGFGIGRSVKWMAEETEKRVQNVEAPDKKWIVASPVAGAVSVIQEEYKSIAVIKPEQGVIFSPISGRIKKLYPMGSAMLIVAETGSEVLVRVGAEPDEYYSSCFRSRVVPNEIVTKGKLLLEYDKENLERQGIDVSVYVSVEAVDVNTEIAITHKTYVKVGEELFRA